MDRYPAHVIYCTQNLFLHREKERHSVATDSHTELMNAIYRFTMQRADRCSQQIHTAALQNKAYLKSAPSCAVLHPFPSDRGQLSEREGERER